MLWVWVVVTCPAPLSVCFLLFSYQPLFRFAGEPVLSGGDGWWWCDDGVMEVHPDNGALLSPAVFHVPLGDNTFGVSVWWILTIQKETKQMRSFTLLPSPSPSPFPLPWGKTISILNDAICAHESLSRQVLVFVYCSFCCVTRVIVCICAYVCLCMSVCVCVCAGMRWYALV